MTTPAEQPTPKCPVCGSAGPLGGALSNACQVCAGREQTVVFRDGEWATLLTFHTGAWVRLAFRGDAWVLTNQSKAFPLGVSDAG